MVFDNMASSPVVTKNESKKNQITLVLFLAAEDNFSRTCQSTEKNGTTASETKDLEATCHKKEIVILQPKQ